MSRSNVRPRDRVQDLGVRRVERGEEDRVEEEDRPDVGAVATNRVASGMWYQSESARSMPPARLPSVGTAHAATSAATTTATSRAASGRPAAPAGPDSRRRPGESGA